MKWLFPPCFIHTQRVKNFPKSAQQERDLNPSPPDSQPLASHCFMIPQDTKTLFLPVITKPFQLIISFVFHTILPRLAGEASFPFYFPRRGMGAAKHRPPGPGPAGRGTGPPKEELLFLHAGFSSALRPAYYAEHGFELQESQNPELRNTHRE